MAKPQVALLHYSAPPVIGGVESTIGAHARLFAGHGYPVKIVAGRGDQSAFDESAHHVEFVPIPEMDSRHPQVEALQKELNAGRVPTAFGELQKQLERALASALQDVTLCLAHNLITLHKNLALTAALHHLAYSRRFSLIAWCHDFAWEDPVYANELHDGFPWDLLRAPWEHTKYVVVSEARRGELAQLLQLDANAISVVPPGIAPREFFEFSGPTTQWVTQFALLGAKPLLLLPARVTRRKNIELAIDVIAGLRALGLSPTLVVMGPLGPHNPNNRAYLEQLKTRAAETGVADAVRFLQEYGTVPDTARRELYALADALLFPSVREGFGIPILEAGLTRLPIFCSDLPPFRESAGAYVNYFTPEEPPGQIARRMADFFSSDPRYQLKRRVLEHYSWEHIFADRIIPLVERMTAYESQN